MPFSLTSIPDNTVLTLTYASNASDPTSALATCQANCVLAHDADVPYQDFLFPANWTMTGFELDIFGFYGAGAGLHLLQLLSDGAYDYAVAANNLSPCTTGLAASTQSTVETSGNWTQESVFSGIGGTDEPVLYGLVPGGTAVASAPSLTWTPYVVEDGTYEILFRTPGCQAEDDCPARTSVSVVVTPTGGKATTTTIDQTNTADELTSVYSGSLTASSGTGGGVAVTLGLASGAATDTSVTYHMVADLISLVANSTNGTISSNSTAGSVATTSTGHGIFEFALVGTGTFGDAVASASGLSATSTLTNATGFDDVSFLLSSGAVVNSLVTVGSGTSTRVFVGGDFVYTSGAATSANIVEYSGAVATVAPNGGLAGTITSLVELSGYLYAAGTFTATTDGAVTGLDGAARWQYNSTGSAWTALATVPSVGGSIAALGVVNTGTNESIVAVGGGGSGLAFFNPSTSSWNSTAAGFFLGNLTAIGGAASLTSSNGTAYLAGNVLAAGSTSAPGGAILSSSNNVPSLSSFDFTLDSETSTAASSTATKAVVRRTPTATKRSTLRAAMSIMLPRSPKPPLRHDLAPRAAASAITTSLPSALTAETTGEILSGAFWKNGSTSYVLLAGHYTSSSGVINAGLYDTNRATFKGLTGEVITGTVTQTEIFGSVAWLGGNFTASLGRQGLATYDLSTSSVDTTVPALIGGFILSRRASPQLTLASRRLHRSERHGQRDCSAAKLRHYGRRRWRFRFRRFDGVPEHLLVGHQGAPVEFARYRSARSRRRCGFHWCTSPLLSYSRL